MLAVEKRETNKKSSRIITLDLMRGYFMISIILNHLQWYPSGLDWVSMRGSLFVSAAEGFFLLSGIVLGMVRGKKLIDKPFKVPALLLLERGIVLYIASIVLTFLFMVIGWTFFIDNPGLKPGIRPIDQPLGEVLLGITNLTYIYGWADFLRLYAVFLIISPLALWLIRQGKWYILMTISALFWLLFPYVNSISSYSPELLMLLSWQIIFFGGLVIGFYWRQIMQWWKNLPDHLAKFTLNSVLVIACVTLVANIVLEFGQTYLPLEVTNWYYSIQPYFSKEELPIVRLILFSLWFVLGFQIFKHFESLFVKFLGWILIPFGQNSLYVYILHAFLIFFAHTLIAPASNQTNWMVSGVLSLVIVGIIYLAVRFKFLFRIIPR